MYLHSKTLKTNLQEFDSGILVTVKLYFSFVTLYLVIIVKIKCVNIPIYKSLNDSLLIDWLIVF